MTSGRGFGEHAFHVLDLPSSSPQALAHLVYDLVGTGCS